MNKLNALQIVLGILATYRLSVLVTRDTFPFGPPRDWLVRNYTGRLVELVQCVWCMSMWLGAMCLVLTIYEWPTWQYFEAVFAFSAVAGFLGELT